MSHRILGIAAVASMLLPGIANALFFDVETDNPYAAAIEWATRKGIVGGYEDRSFQPKRGVNRAEFARILSSMLFTEDSIQKCLKASDWPEAIFPMMDFDDVPHDQWFAPYVCTAWRNGLVSGSPDGLFHPEEGVNFVEAAKMLSIGFELAEVKLPDLGPEANVLWYEPYVRLMVKEQAVPPTIMGMGHYLSRGEVVEMLYRLSDVETTGEITPPKPSLPIEEITYPVSWVEYKNRDYHFAFHHPSPWKAPDILARGSVPDGLPGVRSAWTVFTGAENKQCTGFGGCIERDLQIQGYDLKLLESMLDELETSEQVYDITFQGELRGMPALIFLEQGRCVHWRALFKGRYFVYLITAKCSGENSELEELFNRFIQGFSEI